VAWVYFKKGDCAKALPYMETATRTNSKNPVLLCRAGLIYSKLGKKEKAKMVLKEGLEKNANISESLREAAIKELNSLN